MSAVDVISKKRDGGELSAADIDGLIRAYVAGDVPDYQMSAWAMAVLLRGMTAKETAALTESMLRTGATLSWPSGGVPRVDKHSTGGIGDKVTLVLTPLLACCDLWLPTISGRGLGPTGGTLDKLEAIPGYRTDLTQDELQDIVGRVGCAITGATANLVPADRKLYALRDVTGTVPSIPLITASIMSKKLAEDLDALVLDVKWGSGAFMRSIDQAYALARSMVDTGRRLGLATMAVVTDMNQPLGRCVGNAIEVDEAVAALKGDSPADLQEVVIAIGVELLMLTGREPAPHVARKRLTALLSSGQALEKFREMVTAQGGDLEAPRAVQPGLPVPASRSGHVTAIDTAAIGRLVVAMGGGRRVMTDQLDRSTGVTMAVRLGDRVESGQPLMLVHARADVADRVRPDASAAVTIADAPVDPPVLIVERLT